MAVKQKSSRAYYRLKPEEIADDINANFNISDNQIIKVIDTEFIIHPHVYPSHRFRSTNVMLNCLLEHTQNKRICEIGCGCGTLGQIALKKGASYLVQGDINSYAVANAKDNKKFHGFSDKDLKIYESNCFDNIPKEKFDIIIFAMPYHNEPIKIEDPLLRAFYDPNFESIKKFLKQAPDFSQSNTQIFIAFSNKGDTQNLETVFELSSFQWELYRVANSNEEYDNRIYRLAWNIGK